MHGPTCIVWANLTRFSLEALATQQSNPIAASEGEIHRVDPKFAR
jgi:hypothetical protein